MSVPNLLGLN